MEYTLNSGAKLVVTVSSFIDAKRLLNSILKALQPFDISAEAFNVDLSLDGLRKAPSGASQLVDKLISIVTSSEVESALQKCFERVSYNNLKVNNELFDDLKQGDQAREDYYEVCLKVIEVNCKPFFKQTFSGLKILPKSQEEPQK